MALMNGGVVVALFSATYRTLKSCVSSEIIIAAQAIRTATKEPMTARRPLTARRGSPPRVASRWAMAAYTVRPKPTRTDAWPIAGITGAPVLVGTNNDRLG